MLRNRMMAGASAAGIVIGGASLAQAAVVYQDSFESSNVGAGLYLYSGDASFYSNPSGTAVSAPGATFNGFSGIQSNGSAWNFAPVPDGTFGAFLQSYNTNPDGNQAGAFELTLSGLTSGDTYTLSFSIAARSGYGVDPFSVSLGADNLGSWTAPSTSWTLETVTFTYNGAATLDFTGVPLGGGNSSVGIDDVTIAFVPEPSTWAMLIAGLAGLGFVRARRGKLSVSMID